MTGRRAGRMSRVPVANPTVPTMDQMLNLADRAEYKGGLNAAEADRLRRGLADLGSALALAEERVDHYKALSEQHRLRVNRLKQLRPEQRVDAVAAVPLVEDTRLTRLAEMANRWLSIPQRHQAGRSVLAVVNDRPRQRNAA